MFLFLRKWKSAFIIEYNRKVLLPRKTERIDGGGWHQIPNNPSCQTKSKEKGSGDEQAKESEA